MKIIPTIRSDYSLGESALRVEQIVKLAKKGEYEEFIVADTMTVSSIIELSKEAQKEGIKVIVGCRLRVVDRPTDKTKPKEQEVKNHIVYPKVYVKNEQGLQDLFALLSRANEADYFHYVPRIGWEEFYGLLEKGNVACSSGDFWGVLHHPRYRDILQRMVSSCGASGAFLELFPIDSPLWDTLSAKAIKLAKEYGMGLLTCRPVLYDDPSKAPALDVLGAIIGNSKMGDPWTNINYVRDFSFLPRTTLAKEAALSKQRIERNLGPGACGAAWMEGFEGLGRLSSICPYVWKKQQVSLPKMAEDEHAELIKHIKAGWARRVLRPVLGYQPAKEQLPLYVHRLSYELDILRSMGFEGYFLVVRDLVRWAKQNQIMVGPGRGSVGGSLVAFLLGITDVDPLRFNLLFERFINPERLDLPDADLDFMSSRRGEVIQYLERKYGRDRVAGVSNFTAMVSAGALRDVSRVWGLSPTDYDCSKLVPKIHGESYSLEAAAEEVPDIERFAQQHPDVWAVATALQGTMRSLGRHAAGIVIAGESIVNRAVMERRASEPTVNWDKRVVEEQGLVKMDILGLSTLDILQVAADKIKARHGVDLDYLQLPLDDPKVLEFFAQGRTVGIFQFESPGMRRLLRDLAQREPLTFEDIVAATALYRPGPMDSGLMEQYISIKQGHMYPSYEHPKMEPALTHTLGVFIYQEQVMQLARDLAGFTLPEADHLRKAMGKKDKEKMVAMRDKWIEGCVRHSGMLDVIAAELFDKIEKFAAYGFNRSHSVEYSIISMWAAWVKVHYPAEFYAASLSFAGEDKLPALVADAESQGIHVIPPDINRSTQSFEIEYDQRREQWVLIAPFKMIKGVSEKGAAAILEARERAGGAFVDKADFVNRVDRRVCNIRIQEALERVGAFAHDNETQPPARHPDRLKDQIELLPGLVCQAVKPDRRIQVDGFVKAEIVRLYGFARGTSGERCEGCDLQGRAHPLPYIGRSPKFVCVTDCPTYSEEKKDKLLEGETSAYVRAALQTAGLSVSDGYFTSLVKSPKTGKQITNAQINGCAGHLMRELDLLKPPVIVLLGGNVIRQLLPGIKGGAMEFAGQVHYQAGRDATVVLGFNPQMIYIDPTKQETLNAVFGKVADIVA